MLRIGRLFKIKIILVRGPKRFSSRFLLDFLEGQTSPSNSHIFGLHLMTFMEKECSRGLTQEFVCCGHEKCLSTYG
jgi:hypothetical protein